MAKNTPLLLLCFLFALLGCQGKKELAADFVEHYNKVDAIQNISSLQQSGDTVIVGSYAVLVANENPDSLSINIVLVSNKELSDEEYNDYENFIPNVLAVDLKNDKLASKLIDQEVKFTISYKSPIQRTVSKITLDKRLIEEITTKKAGQNLEVGEGNKNKNLKPGVKEFLISLNHNLPTVVNEQLQIKMLKIDVNSLNDLAYTIEIGKQMAEKLKDPEMVKVMEKELIADPGIIGLLTRVKGLGLANIKYNYVNDKGERIADIVISPEDFRK